MKRTQVIALAAVVLLAAGVVYLALRTDQPPPLPADADHDRFHSAEACLRCHGPQGQSPKSRNHPVRNDCMSCHAWR